MLMVSTMLGAMWTVSSRLVGRAIDFVILLVLARVLSPADFGLTALAISLVVVIDTVLEVQLLQALTRLKIVTKHHLDTAFTIGILRSLVLLALLIAAAWPVSIIYEDDKLIGLVLVLSIGPVCRGLYSPKMVSFTSALKFKQVFIMEVAGKVCSASLSMLVLYLGGGYWAIVTNTVAAPFMMGVFSYVLAPYRPGLRLSEWPEFQELLGWMSLSQLVSALNWQLDRLVLGRFIPAPTLGQYVMASDVAVLPVQTIVGPAMAPLLAALSRLDQDPARLRSAFLRAVRLSMMIAAPACIGMSMTSELLVSVLFGPKWALAGDYIRWIALTIMLGAYMQPLQALLLVIRKTRAVFHINLAELTIRIAVIPAGIYLLSVPGVIAGRALISVIVFGLCLDAVRRFLQVPVATQLLNLWKVLLGCLVMAVVVALVQKEIAPHALPPIVALAAQVASGAAVYVLTLFALGVRLHKADIRFA